MSTGAIIVLVVVVVLVLAVGAWFAAQQSRRSRLRRRFGPEYDRLVSETGNRKVAERELAEREKRHARYDLRPLSDDERIRYLEQWTLLQERFVDGPGETVDAAEQLVQQVMRDRGYPADDFDQRVADLSVAHAPAVSHYRDGREIHLRHEQAGMSTEELRQALTHYRAVFVSVSDIHEDARAGRGSTRDGTAQDIERTNPQDTEVDHA